MLHGRNYYKILLILSQCNSLVRKIFYSTITIKYNDYEKAIIYNNQ